MQVVREVAPHVISAAVQREAPAAVRDQVQLVMREMVEHRTEPLRKEVVGQDRHGTGMSEVQHDCMRTVLRNNHVACSAMCV